MTILMEPYTQTPRREDNKCPEETSVGNINWSIIQHLSYPAAGSNKCLDCLLSQALADTAASQTGTYLHSTSHLRSAEQSPAMASSITSPSQQPPSISRKCNFYFPSRCQRSNEKRPTPNKRPHEVATITAIKSGPHPMRMLTLCVLTLTLCSSQTLARSVGICRGIPCANGGHLLVDNSVWGHCRCRCPPNFLGPYCQYQVAKKRSSDTETSVDNRRLGRSDALDRIRLRLLELTQRMALTQISRELNTLGDPEVPDNNSEYPADEEIGSRIDGPDTSMTSSMSDGPRRSWFQELSTR